MARGLDPRMPQTEGSIHSCHSEHNSGQLPRRLATFGIIFSIAKTASDCVQSGGAPRAAASGRQRTDAV
ncbi:hypothetical protein CBM2587_B10109 [Cupriavidus taiwanensis]|uniref:Uncharacterized protein n=1 Tax=Cupriavidus taiwanensis TaxID=164546 RepID=A0A375BX90_9BURK|nr:hypothetical protein CBM2587_B10109 [Cupriavidus taiwanensis]